MLRSFAHVGTFIITKNHPEEWYYPHTIDADKIDLPIAAYGSTANSPWRTYQDRSRRQNLAVPIITKNRHGADDGFLVYVATQLLSVLRVPPRL